MNRAVAVIGMACRFPGGVRDPEGLWRLIANRGDAITEIPPDRIDLERFFDARARTPGRTTTRWGGFLDEIEMFDADFFGISPREAESLDPAQRLLLECAWEAFEDANVDPRTAVGAPVGVFVGQWLSDFEARLFADAEAVDFHATTGSGRYATSGRLSFVLGAVGPSITVDTACSSSLVAVHLACQSIADGESSMAVAAGVNVILQPHISIAYSQSGMMTPAGRCRFGDADGDGYVRSEGAAAILLKPLAAALADGDPIRAVIRGSAVNQDGRGSGQLATPSREGQAAMLRTAYARAGVDPASVGYVEAHGTGTRAGDPVEIGALADVIAAAKRDGTRLQIGSVKTNIGHTEGAAGLAGLIKCVLALEHAEIPAGLHLDTPNPAIAWDEVAIDVPQRSAPWAPGGSAKRVAGVSAFGITGTNAHIVLEEAPPVAPDERGAEADRPRPLVLSAGSDAALRALAGAYADLLDAAHGPRLDDVCATAARHRAALARRAAFVSSDRGHLVDRLRRFAEGDDAAADAVGSAPEPGCGRIAFVLPGQGGQWHGMARELLAAEPAFFAAIDACDAALPADVTWTVRGQLLAEPGDGVHRLDEIGVIQPVLLAVEIALGAMWRSMGVDCTAAVGHSMGEVAAAHLAGAITLVEAMRIICTRSALMQRTSGAGAMAMLDLSVADAAARLVGHGDDVVIAVSNGPTATVVSGEPDAVAAVVRGCEADGVFARLVKVDVASHSPQMQPLVPELVAALDDVRPTAATARLYSTVDAALRPGELWDAAYWGRNLREPVMFGATVEAMIADGVDAIVELSPHPTLLPALARSSGDVRTPSLVGSLRREAPERAALLASLCSLWCGGHPVEWTRIFGDGTYRRAALPHYPWQRLRHWSAAAEQVTPGAVAGRRAALTDDMLGWLQALRWDAITTAEPDADAVRGGVWIVLGDAPWCDELVDGLTAARLRVERPGAPADVAAIDPAAVAGVVIVASGVGAGFDAVATLTALQEAWAAATPRRVWWITRGAHRIASEEPSDDAPEQASVWGAARVIAVEHPQWWGGAVDLPADEPLRACADAVIATLLAADGEDQVAIRDGRRSGLRLAPAERPQRAARATWRHDASYLVTGGLGGVGRHAVAEMVAAGARRLVLLTRTALPPRATWAQLDPATELGGRVRAVMDLEHAGAAVHVLVADVADEGQLRAALAGYAADGWPPIRGVVHAAGVLDSHLTADLDAVAYRSVVAPKLHAARLLDELLPDAEIFVVFSSMMAFWPPAGMANYAAANAGLDALARLRRARGRHAVSIQWGPWENLGLLARAATSNVDAFAREGFGSFSGAQGAACFGGLIAYQEPVVAVVPIDWAQLRAAHPGRDIALLRAAPGEGGSATTTSATAERLRQAPAAERRGILAAVVRDTVAAVLRVSPAQLDARRPFGSMGLDSLMALELRNRLEGALAQPLSATIAWNYPTVDALAGFLATIIDGAEPSSDTPPPAPSQATAHEPDGELFPDVASLSDDDALRLLRGAR